ncbi:MAG: hypothetical protein KJ904_00055 [Alphaproteobacteria bacterium]|uniref:Uncharacterized protein n=1 Tax=viral metagenome TaxID=1070528 RepID=A0A6M3M338_9ZZZZ|nr:hypothetical protein [Alphaproteobacteria bacterium]MBU0798635.1 hypothetical protein [Alphaproteobacteria bacterium]MBU0885535.1 hypothetical protein [Alphaproteobacteria bacterium]MBU1811887.1 hypothetical protein [Alphaproteobacteria bacterium]MBU2089859.1 hypothetical protein [Alphaproteobacteria bacterium]
MAPTETTAPAPIGAFGTLPDARAAMRPIRIALATGQFYRQPHDLQRAIIMSLVRHIESQTDVLQSFSDSVRRVARQHEALVARAQAAGVTIPNPERKHP